ncbi:ABC transporter permease [Paenibacillus bovis]|uniref:Lantibiotic ABC transporter permease n=1 Tax=Paenibacillus bovis TaxID=1616788 RepID=A0A172ZBF1_9BACL|nr:ABC transporter permease [Paenibacillus bovis]ANF94948.1 hypothetical protein AR543_02125 [Paenibacillus bovis]
MNMTSYLGSEFIKYRRTLTLWLIAAGPLVFAVMQLAFNFIAPGFTDWSRALMNVYNWWSVIGLPFGIILITALSVSYERKSGSPKLLQIHPVRKAGLYLSKLVVLSVQVFVACLLLAAGLVIFCGWNLDGTLPWSTLLYAVGLSWLCAMGQLAIMLLLAHLLSFGWTVIAGLIGLFLSIMLSSGVTGMDYYPWMLPIRALGMTLGFQTNGMSLDVQTLTNQATLVWGSVFGSLAECAIFAGLGAFIFSRKEVG